MNLFVKTSAMALLIGSGIAHALNPVQGWYGGVLIGANYTPSADFFSTPAYQATTPGTSTTLKIDTAATLNYGTMGEIGGQLGYRHQNYRVEGQYFYNNSPYSSLALNSLTINGVPTHNTNTLKTSSDVSPYIEGSTDTGLLMLNGFYDFLPTNPSGHVAPYLGLGLGYAYSSNNFSIYFQPVVDGSITQYKIKQHMTSPAGQGILGLTYFLDDFSSFGLDFRYLTTSGKSDLLQSRVQVYTLNFLFNGAFNFG
jgi:hypothetical protein